ncbi:MAG: hypothetical protein ACPG4U_16255, partial [Pseudomonadales bacterium]
DRLELSLYWPEDVEPDLKSALQDVENALRERPDAEQHKLTSAKHYLADKTNSGLVFNALSQHIAGLYNSRPGLRWALQQTPRALMIADVDIEQPIVRSLQQTLSTLYTSAPKALPTPNSWRAASQHIRRQDKGYNTLLASELSQNSNRQNILDLMSYFTLRQRLSLLGQHSDVAYRLVRQPLYNFGYQALHLFRARELSNAELDTLLTHLTAPVSDVELETIAQRLIEEYEKLLEDDARRHSLYSKKHFYNLAMLSLDEYSELVETIEPSALSAQISQSLARNNAIIISMQPD